MALAEASATRAPSRLTRPWAISAWTRPRDISGKRIDRSLSMRPPPSSGPTATMRTPTASSSSSSTGPGSASEAMLLAGGFLVAHDRALAFLQLLVQLGIVQAEPFEDHGGMLQLLVGVVQQDRLEARIVAVVGALAVPVDRVEFLLQRGDGVVDVQRLTAQLLARDVQGFAGHGGSFSCGILCLKYVGAETGARFRGGDICGSTGAGCWPCWAWARRRARPRPRRRTARLSTTAWPRAIRCRTG